MDDRASTRPSYTSDSLNCNVDDSGEYCVNNCNSDDDFEGSMMNDDEGTDEEWPLDTGDSSTVFKDDSIGKDGKRFALSIRSGNLVKGITASPSASNKKAKKSKFASLSPSNSSSINCSWETVAANAKKKECDLAQRKYEDLKKHDQLDYQFKLMTKYKDLKELGYSDRAIVKMMPNMKPLTQLESEESESDANND
jgi:hypothetical protein